MIKLSTGQRRVALALLLAAAVAAALHEDAPPEQAPRETRAARPASTLPDTGAVRPAAVAGATVAVPVLDPDRLARAAERRSQSAPVADAFVARDWQAPVREAQRQAAAAAARAQPESPPPPQAPPLPFTFLGMMEEQGGQTVFLAQGDRAHVVRVGEAIDGNWRLERVTDRSVLITWVPLGIQQALPLGGPK